MAKKKKPIDWKNRIVEYGEMPANQYLAHELNARRHPGKQREALIGSLNEVGWVAPVIVSARTGKLLDGHARIEETLTKDEDAPVPFVKVDVTEGEERLILASFDPIANQATYDREVLDMLLREVATGDAGLQQLLADLAEEEKLVLGLEEALKNESALVEDPAPEEDDFGGIYAFREGAIFPTSNKYGIPDLLPEMCADVIPQYVYDGFEVIDASKTLFVHHTAKFDGIGKDGILAFYVDDWRFESVWLDAVVTIEKFHKVGWGAVIAPDFSVWRDDPAAVQLWNIYRSRWCARYWQEAGIKVIPSLNWSDERSYEFAFAGIPTNLPVVSVQCRTTRSKQGREFFVKGINQSIERLTPQNVIFYGGSEHQHWIEPMLPTGMSQYHWLESWTSLRREKVFKKGGAK